MNLHLVDDEKFINGAIDLFEKYDLNNNIFIVGNEKNLKYIIKRKEVVTLDFRKIRILHKLEHLVKEYKIERVFIHYLTPFKAFISNGLKRKHSLKTYWIFYGADLYSLLYKDYNYALYDFKIKKDFLEDKQITWISNIKRIIQNRKSEKNEITEFFEGLNYFCFWNYFDYELFTKYYKTKADLINFAYFNVIDYSRQNIKKKEKLIVLVNNSASTFGNHLTILTKIFDTDSYKLIDQIISPLSYGNDSIKKEVIEFGTKKFDKKFLPLLDYVDISKYYKLLNTVSIAFFGAKRQEAAGNIFYLLKNGVKVFLRKDNNMLRFLREKGFVVFDFEEDFSSINDLKPLDVSEMIKNQECFHSLFNETVEAKSMIQMINS